MVAQETKTADQLEMEFIDSINRSQVARDTGLTLSHISRIFNGERQPSLSAARKIALSLDISIEGLGKILDRLAVDRVAGGPSH